MCGNEEVCFVSVFPEKFGSTVILVNYTWHNYTKMGRGLGLISKQFYFKAFPLINIKHSQLLLRNYQALADRLSRRYYSGVTIIFSKPSTILEKSYGGGVQEA